MENKLRVIIADDEAITLYDLHERLQAGGYQVVGTASDGIDALELCRKYRPDVTLLDIRMPLLDGLSAAKIIADEDLCHCIIFLTAYSDSQFVKKASGLGAYGFLVKPISDSTLFSTIEVAYKRSIDAAELKADNQLKDRRITESKFIERAKVYLMNDFDCSEDQAYKFMRKRSMDTRTSLSDVAKEIIARHETL